MLSKPWGFVCMCLHIVQVCVYFCRWTTKCIDIQYIWACIWLEISLSAEDAEHDKVCHVYKASVSFWNIWVMAYSKLFYSISVYRVERKKRSRDRNLNSVFVGFPHTPYFNVGCFRVFWTERKKRSFMFRTNWYACACNIEVGGVGDVLLKQLIYVASVFFARPGVKTCFSKNVFGFCWIAASFFVQDFEPLSSLYTPYDRICECAL